MNVSKCNNQKELEKLLKSKLLSLGGEKVEYKHEAKWELKRMVFDGRVFDEKVTKVRGAQSQCHRNIAEYYDNNGNSHVYRYWHHFKIITGYALSDGIWVAHTWGTKRNHLRLIESTKVKRDIYYGYELTKEESEEFVNNEL